MFGNQNQYPQVVEKKRSFLATAALGASVVVVCLIGSVTTLGICAMSILDSKTEDIFEFAEMAVGSVPELVDSLPPVLADLVNDERRPDYADRIDVSVRLVEAYQGRGIRSVIEVRNRGDEVVSLISMRIVVLNDRGEPVCESNEWAATPVAAEDEWRGPLLPGSERMFAGDGWLTGKGGSGEDLTVSYEITDVRVWRGGDGDGGVVALTRAD